LVFDGRGDFLANVDRLEATEYGCQSVWRDGDRRCGDRRCGELRFGTLA
jgi:hypothetical protein